MTLYYQSLEPWRGERINDIRYGSDIADWPDADLAAIGLYPPRPYEVIPEGKQSGAAVEWDGSGVRFALEAIPAEPVPDRVTSRQFFLQLEALGLLSAVEAWVDSQALPLQIAFERSSSFVRDDVMLQQGFAALSFSTEQIDGFFRAASEL